MGAADGEAGHGRNINVRFFADREYVADSMFEASQLADVLWRDPSEEGVRQSLAALDATHVLWCEQDWGVSYPQGLFALLTDPARAAPIYRSEDGRYRIYELRSTARRERSGAADGR